MTSAGASRCIFSPEAAAINFNHAMARYKGPRLTTAPPSTMNTMTIQALDGLSSEEGDNSQPEERDDNQSEEGNGSQPETKDHLCVRTVLVTRFSKNI